MRALSMTTHCFTGSSFTRSNAAVGWDLVTSAPMISLTHLAGSVRRRGRSDHKRAHDGRDLLQLEVLDPVDVEAGLLDGGQSRPVAVAAHDQPIHPVQTILLTGEPGICRSDMLQEEQPTTRPQRPANFSQRP